MRHRKQYLQRKIVIPRIALQSLANERIAVEALAVKFGVRRTSRGDRLTLLLEDVTLSDTGETLADHLWMTETLPFQISGFRPGVRMRFWATVRGYTKGIPGALVTDWTLKNPKAVQIVERAG